MLVLSRKVGEKIVIDGNITVTVLAVNRPSSGVKIGIEAPPDVKVFRKELKKGTESEKKGEAG